MNDQDYLELIEVLTQGSELEWGQGGDGRTEGDDEAFAGQVQPIKRIIILICWAGATY